MIKLLTQEILLFYFPSEHGTVTTGRVCTGEIHGVRTARCGTLAQIAVGAHRHEHKLMVEIVLPHKHFCFRFISGQADITSKSLASTEDVTSVLALEDNFALTFVYEVEKRQAGVFFGIGVMQ